LKKERVFIGIDIGGTKTAVSAGDDSGRILEKKRFHTDQNLDTALDNILKETALLLEKYGNPGVTALGVSCGGPLDSEKGVIQSPPNLPGWDDVPLIEILESRFSLPAYLENDANACALAEWSFGAGKGCDNMIFLTVGTGMGAGLILNGRLYRGASGLAGELGHIRVTAEGPLGYGKRGSLEGWCSGGGLSGAFFDSFGEKISGGEVCIRAEKGDKKALEVTGKSANMLGRGLALLIDIINPERIIIGSVFARSEALFRGPAEEVIKAECLPLTAGACTVHAAKLGESLGDIAALCAAVNGVDRGSGGLFLHKKRIK
jgi:glucokinase